MIYQVQSTLTAFGLLTEDQIEALREMCKTHDHKLSVYVDLGLPTGYVAFDHTYPDGTTISGGVSPGGQVST